MSALDSDIGFDAALREAEAAQGFGFRPGRETGRGAGRRGVAAFSVFAGLGVLSVVIFATGYSALISDEPAIWIHRLMALTVAQSVIIAAVAVKLLPIIERRRSSIRVLPRQNQGRPAVVRRAAVAADRSMPPPLPQPKKPVIGGKLAGREFLEYPDGAVEIDTLVGRRRFVSLEAAKEFVGA